MVMFYGYVSLPEGIIPTILHKSCIIPMKTTSFRHFSPPIDSTGHPPRKKSRHQERPAIQTSQTHFILWSAVPDLTGELLVLG